MVSDRVFAKSIASDITKLSEWRRRLALTGYLSSTSPDLLPDYVMIAIDNRSKPMDDALQSSLVQLAHEHDVRFHYLGSAF